jgi:hypothetical protein
MEHNQQYAAVIDTYLARPRQADITGWAQATALSFDLRILVRTLARRLHPSQCILRSVRRKGPSRLQALAVSEALFGPTRSSSTSLLHSIALDLGHAP